MLLAFETSCDETSVAVVQRGRVLGNAVSSQVRLHAEYGGVVPELAAREHLRNLAPVAAAALAQAKAEPRQLKAVAATQGPGLPNALVVGLKAAEAMAFVLRVPFFGIHHHEAHLYSPWIRGEPPVADFSTFEPHIALIVSGGHTLLVHVQSLEAYRVLGSTVDDAAGECFDKTGKLLGLAYPAGPIIDRLAERGNAERFSFPRPLLNDPSDDFSFSGLKTSVRYFLRDHPELIAGGEHLPDLCAGIQAAIVEVLVTKTIRAARRLSVRCVTVSGGVACNRALRQALERACRQDGLRLRTANPVWCTDNAAMIGVLGELKLNQGRTPTVVDSDILPSWELKGPASGMDACGAMESRDEGGPIPAEQG